MTRFDVRKAMQLYAITDRQWLGERTLTQVCEAVLRGGATFLQLREKTLHGDALLAEAREIRALTARYGVPFVVNDDVDVALACGADGVHVGQSDILGRDIRALMGPDKIVGMTANTVERAQAAQAAGADYIGVGAIFGTSTKKDAVPITYDRLQAICAAVTIPVVAIGGITADNLMELKGSGIAGAAVVSALFAQPDPEQAAARLRALTQEVVYG